MSGGHAFDDVFVPVGIRVENRLDTPERVDVRLANLRRMARRWCLACQAHRSIKRVSGEGEAVDQV